MYKAAVIFSDTAVHFLFSVLVLRGKWVMYFDVHIFVLYVICSYVLLKKNLWKRRFIVIENNFKYIFMYNVEELGSPDLY